jgi:hypothetical protein
MLYVSGRAAQAFDFSWAAEKRRVPRPSLCEEPALSLPKGRELQTIENVVAATPVKTSSY